MLWKARITMPDHPGTLARLTGECGAAGIDIVALQVFRGAGAVTDELVLALPDDWGQVRLAELVDRASGVLVAAHPCGEETAADQPTRYVHAARDILTEPSRFPEVVAELFEAEREPLPVTGARRDAPSPGDTMDMVVGDVAVQVHRATPFTPSEQARGAALAGLVSEVLSRRSVGVTAPERALDTGTRPTYVVSSHAVCADVGGTTVGRAVLAEATGPGTRRLVLEVDPSWRRRGIGGRLLVEAARRARDLGDEAMVLVTRADNQAVLPMVLGSGLRGRITLTGDELTVRVPLRDLAPPRTVVGARR
jgi:ribosomal protein S18 acetylase RimI-like enzyme